MQAARIETRKDDVPADVLTTAALRAAGFLRITNRELAAIVGVSPSYVTKLKAGTARVGGDAKVAELTAHFLRAYRSLDAIMGGDDAASASWLRNHNTVLGDAPITCMTTIRGLIDTVAYLDQRRAIL